jgi:hypothetical protein
LSRPPSGYITRNPPSPEIREEVPADMYIGGGVIALIIIVLLLIWLL